MVSLLRLRQLFAAQVDALFERFADPEKMAAQTLRAMESELAGIRQQAALTIAVERRLERELERHESAARRWRESAQFALLQDREDLARWALCRSFEHQDAVQQLREQYDAAHLASAEVRSSLHKLQASLDEAQRRILVLSSKKRTAQTIAAAHHAVAIGPADFQSMATQLDHWEDRLIESADLLLAAVEIIQPHHSEEAELAALAEKKRLDKEIARLEQVTHAQ